MRVYNQKVEQLSASIEQIEDHNNKVRRNVIPCNLEPCQCCGVSPDEFKRHEARQRQFYVIVDQIIKTVFGLLLRWKCPGCGKTATDYPEFALPYKRYTVPTILSFSAFYTEDDDMTYQEINRKMPVAYPESEKQMSYTSIYRWITSLGNSSNICRNAIDFILQDEPSSNICRELANIYVPPKKYRSKERYNQLSQCRQFLKIEKLFKMKFGVKIFPNFAKNYSFQ